MRCYVHTRDTSIFISWGGRATYTPRNIQDTTGAWRAYTAGVADPHQSLQSLKSWERHTKNLFVLPDDCCVKSVVPGELMAEPRYITPFICSRTTYVVCHPYLHFLLRLPILNNLDDDLHIKIHPPRTYHQNSGLSEDVPANDENLFIPKTHAHTPSGGREGGVANQTSATWGTYSDAEQTRKAVRG